MQLLRQRLLEDARHLGDGIVRVDSFMNHQIDPVLMKEIGKAFANLFADVKTTKVLTAEASGIAPGLAVAMELEVPVVFAKKHRPITMSSKHYSCELISPTHGDKVELSVSSEYLLRDDRVLIIDDFLASARTILALSEIVWQSGATCVGVGAVIEKMYTPGRSKLAEQGILVHSLAKIESFDGERIVLGDG